MEKFFFTLLLGFYGSTRHDVILHLIRSWGRRKGGGIEIFSGSGW